MSGWPALRGPGEAAAPAAEGAARLGCDRGCRLHAGARAAADDQHRGRRQCTADHAAGADRGRGGRWRAGWPWCRDRGRIRRRGCCASSTNAPSVGGSTTCAASSTGWRGAGRADGAARRPSSHACRPHSADACLHGGTPAAAGGADRRACERDRRGRGQPRGGRARARPRRAAGGFQDHDQRRLREGQARCGGRGGNAGSAAPPPDRRC